MWPIPETDVNRTLKLGPLTHVVVAPAGGTIVSMTNPVSSADPAAGDPVAAGRDALARHNWQKAFDLLSGADRDGALSGADLEALAEASFFAARSDLEIEIKERAFKAYLAAGDEVRAAYVAMRLARDYWFAGKMSISSAWGRRGEKLLEGKPETYAHGYLALGKSELASSTGNIDEALVLAEQAVEIASRAAQADLQAYALTNLGRLKIATGSTSDGMALLEEASISAVNGELSPFASGATCCTMIAACRDLTDYRRATEWTEAAEKYCERQSVAAFPGVCRIHRAEVVAVGGAWDRAEQELHRAADELSSYSAMPPLADGHYAIGEIRRLKGDYEAAEDSLREAGSMGRTPQPALALIRLAQGKVRAAASAIESALSEASWDQWATVRLLPAQVEIAIAAGELGLARSAAEELGRIVDTYKSPALEAGKHQALARVLLAEGDAAAAAHEVRAAIRLWREVASPYEVARARAILAKALRAADDDDSADYELRAAHAEFERLGAKPDAAAAERELQAAAERRSAPLQTRKTFMFTDIVGSTNLAELLGNEQWERLLRWHDDKLRDLVAKHGGEIVNSTGDGFFVAFDSARQGIECARSIQRALTEHRQGSGFAITVRIGLHSAEANRRGADYSGVGVHLASRVASVAGGGEIVATTDTLDSAGESATSNPREVTLKGVSTPVGIATVAWAES
jgi:class 3 adenylate cyclase